MAKRCICGASSTFPICDNTHESKGWTCTVGVGQVDLALVASSSLQNLAGRLAHRFGATVLTAPQRLVCERLVVFSDGQDVGVTRRIIADVSAQHVMVCGVGVTAASIQWAFPGVSVRELEDRTLGGLWQAAQAAVSGFPASVAAASAVSRPSVFLSHAVADESHLERLIGTLRDGFGVDLFVCADSIPPGAVWHERIAAELEQRDVFLLVVSRASSSSTFCAFEVGVAVAMGKPIRLVSIDGSRPPAFVQHLQAADVPRLIRAKPWLDVESALLEACLSSLTL